MDVIPPQAGSGFPVFFEERLLFFEEITFGSEVAEIFPRNLCFFLIAPVFACGCIDESYRPSTKVGFTFRYE